MSQHAHPKEIVVIGAGIVGASIAFRLAQRGAVVTVTDAGEPGQGASTVSFAWINARDKNPRASTSRNRTGWNASPAAAIEAWFHGVLLAGIRPHPAGRYLISIRQDRCRQ